MCVGICGQASGESVDPCNFYSFKKNQKRKFHIFFFRAPNRLDFPCERDKGLLSKN